MRLAGCLAIMMAIFDGLRVFVCLALAWYLAMIFVWLALAFVAASFTGAS